MKKIVAKLAIIILGIVLFQPRIILAANSQPDPEGQSNPETNRYDEGNEGFGKNTKKKVSGINTNGTKTIDTTNGSSILDTVQKAINWILGMLSFIALLLCLRGGFQMLTAAGDDGKVKTGTKILKNAAIGLAVIGLSWLVVSFIFRIIDKVA